MDWLLGDAYLWFGRNATLIAGIEFAIIVIFGPGKMILTYLMNRKIRKTANSVAELLQRSEANETNAERRHRELIDIRSALNKVDMKPLGDSARVGRLPEGTNIVEMPSGEVRLALPIRLSGAVEGGLQVGVSGAVTLGPLPEQDESGGD